MMNDKEYEKRFDKWTDTLNRKQHTEFLELEIKRGEMLKEVIIEAKKEVFDDFDENVFQQLRTLSYQSRSLKEQCDLIKDWKQRHLSTFANKQKRHNSRTIQSANDEICDLHNTPISECGCAGSLEDKAD